MACLICDSVSRYQIEAKVNTGCQLRSVQTFAKQLGVNCTIDDIIHHCENHTTEVQLKRKQLPPEPPKELIPDTETIIDILDSVDIDAINRRLDIPEHLADMDSLIDAVQKHSASLLMKASCILHYCLDKYAENPNKYKYPKMQIQGYKALLEAFELSYSYRETVSLPTAIKTLESQGYEIKEGD